MSTFAAPARAGSPLSRPRLSRVKGGSAGAGASAALLPVRFSVVVRSFGLVNNVVYLLVRVRHPYSATRLPDDLLAWCLELPDTKACSVPTLDAPTCLRLTRLASRHCSEPQ